MAHVSKVFTAMIGITEVPALQLTPERNSLAALPSGSDFFFLATISTALHHECSGHGTARFKPAQAPADKSI